MIGIRTGRTGLFAATAALVFAQGVAATRKEEAERRPNVVIIYTDDLGYGDLSSYGHPTIRTPVLDGLATSGQKWTSFYAPAELCTPSRAGLLTGRLPIRSGMHGEGRRVLYPDSADGLPQEEVTIAEMLKAEGYETMMVGKWHLGHLPEHLPTTQGFDGYFGVPYSNDMNAKVRYAEVRDDPPGPNNYDVPLIRGTDEVERPADQTTLTKRYTEEAVRFIEAAEGPFFLYLAHTMPHVPLFASDGFAGASAAGPYGDTVEEIDWSVGQVVQALRRKGIEEDTLLVFTSDNGPWLIMAEHGGLAGPFRNGKGTTWEGGMRVPAIFSMPGTVEPGLITGIGSALDLLPTIAALTGAALPDAEIDGVDLSRTLAEGGGTDRDTVFYYRLSELYAVRRGPFKAHFITEGAHPADDPREVHETPRLYDVDVDPGERFDIASEHPEIVEALTAIAEAHLASVVPAPSRLEARLGEPRPDRP